MSQFLRDDFDRWHDYGCLINARFVYFGSEWYDEDWGDESGVDFASSAKAIRNLLYLDQKKKDPITLHYNSPGGDWDRGMAIYDCIQGLRSGVRFVGYGCVRSMGSIIIQACKQRFLSPNCRFMIHDGWMGFSGIPKSFEANADECKITRFAMYKIYQDRMKKKNKTISFKDIRDMCQYDNYFSGDRAVELGLADKVLGTEEMCHFRGLPETIE